MGQDISRNMIGQQMSSDKLRNMDQFSNRRGHDRTLTNMRQNTMMDEEKSKKMIGRPNMTQYRANNMQDSKANRMDQDTSSRQVNQMRGIDMTTKVVNPALIGQDIYSNPLL